MMIRDNRKNLARASIRFYPFFFSVLDYRLLVLRLPDAEDYPVFPSIPRSWSSRLQSNVFDFACEHLYIHAVPISTYIYKKLAGKIGKYGINLLRRQNS